MADTSEFIDDVRSEMHGTGIPVRTTEDANNGDLPPGLTIVTKTGSEMVAVAFQRKLVGKVVQTTGETGEDMWQSLDVDTIGSQDLHRVAFKIAALHPPLD